MEKLDKEKLWFDVRSFVNKRLRDNRTEMYTTVQRRRFWLIDATSSCIRVKRERSNYEYEDIPREDFIDMWLDLNDPKFKSGGYARKDLQNGYNWHSAVSFSLIAQLLYIKEIKEGRTRKYYLINEVLKEL